MKIQIRPLRDTLENSLKESVELPGFSSIYEYILKNWHVPAQHIEWYCVDVRAHKDTFMITDKDNRILGFAVLYE